MTTAIAQRVAQMLSESPEFYLSVKKIWKLLVLEGHPINLDNLERLLKSDNTFHVFSAGAEGEAAVENDEQTANEMEALGFYEGPKVALSARKPSASDVSQLIAQNVDRMIAAISKAREHCVPDDTDTQKQLDELLERAQSMKQNLGQLIDE